MNFDNARSSSWSTRAKQFRLWIAASLFGVLALTLADAAFADPPSRVARLGYINGAVSFSPAGEDNWVEAAVNQPLITGDRLWVDRGARAELQVGSAVFYLGAGTSVTLLNLDNRLVQLEVTQGTVNAKVRRLGPRDVVEIDTPNLANSIRRPGSYRVEVDPADDATTVITRTGQAEVYGDGASYLVNAGQGYRFYGAGLRDYDNLEIGRADEFDRWADTRYRRSDRSASARYVSRDVIGYEDLDEYGTWRSTAEYGNVWYPNRVSRDWAPYRDGHWSWVEPWGWTWIDDAPWGFAVSHYGRWANTGGNWGWVPGPQSAQPVYAPALVAFIAGVAIGAAISNNNSGNVGWFPLAPREVYRPSYPVSRGYFNNVNTSNTTVNNTTITNVYNNTRVTNVTYVNQRVPGAVVAVPAAAFAQSRPVGKSRVDVSRDAVAKAPVTPVAAVTPVQASVHGGASAGRRPPAEARARPVVARERPPATLAPFVARERELAAQPGRPLDAKASAAVKPAAPVPAAQVKVVTPPQTPAAAPPPKQAVAQDAPRRSREQRGYRFDGKGQPPEAQNGAPPPEAQKGSPAPEAPKGAQPEAQKGPAFDGKKGPPPAEAPKGPPPSEPRKAGQPPEGQRGAPFDGRGPRSPEAAKEAPSPVTAPPPPASVPRPPEPPKAVPPEAQKAPSPPVSMRRPPEPPKAPSPEAQKAPAPAPDSLPRRRDERRGPSEERRSAQPPVSAPPAPEAPQAAPPENVMRRRDERRAMPPPEERRAPSPPVGVPRAPEPPKAPPPEAQKAPPAVVQRPPEPPKAPSPEERRPAPPPPPPAAPKQAPPPPPVAPPPLPPPKPAPPPPPPVALKPPPAAPPAASPAPSPKPEASKAPDKGERKKDDKKDEK